MHSANGQNLDHCPKWPINLDNGATCIWTLVYKQIDEGKEGDWNQHGKRVDGGQLFQEYWTEKERFEIGR